MNIRSIVAITTIFFVSLLNNHPGVDAAYVRVLVKSDCSTSDIALFNGMFDYMEQYTRFTDTRQLRRDHAIDDDESWLKAIDDLDQHEPLPFNYSIIDDVRNVTVPENATDMTLSSSRELWPAVCADLCAGCVPRRCMVSRCLGYRRRQQRQLQDGVVYMHDICRRTIYAYEHLIESYKSQNLFTSQCINSRAWECIAFC